MAHRHYIISFIYHLVQKLLITVLFDHLRILSNHS